MAAIDKIYGTIDDWVELYVWLKKNKPGYIKFLYDCPSPHSSVKENPITNFPVSADEWIYKNCPIKFVKKGQKSQYSPDTLKEWEREHIKELEKELSAQCERTQSRRRK